MTEPLWLTKARSYIGFQEQAGNRGIQEFIDIAHTGEEGQPWCSIFACACLESVGVRSTRSPAANSFTESPLFVRQQSPQLGTICTFTRPGGNHVAFYTGIDKQGRLLVLGGNQGDKVDIEPHGTDTLTGYWWPAQAATTTLPTTVDHPLIMIGTTGPVVSKLQKLLGIAETGTFDAATDAAVRSFQASRGLDVDGEVGPLTWGALLAATATIRPSGLTQQTIDAIVTAAGVSDLARHKWSNGMAPQGYTKGQAVMFGVAYAKLLAKDPVALAMAAVPPASDKDALSLYAGKFSAQNMNFFRNGGADTLRALFILQTGLGLRESSGRYCEGRDQSATNVEADTCEAGLFQQSWNSRTASPELPKLFASYSAGSQRSFIEIFREGVTPTTRDLENFGSGQGAAFQALAKSCPAFAVECAAIGLRVLRTHWGPINREEAEIVPAADALFRQVQSIVDAQPLDGDVIPPSKLDDDMFDAIVFVITQGDAMDANLKAAMIAELGKPNPNMRALLLQALGAAPGAPSVPGIPSQPSPGPLPGLGGIDLSQIGNLLTNPTVKKILGGQPVTLADILPLIPTVLAMVQGHPPPPIPAGSITPDSTPAPTTMSDTAFNWSTGIGGALTALAGSAAGIIGSPIPGGSDFSITGLLSFAVPLIAGAFGVPAPAAAMIGNVLKGFKK